MPKLWNETIELHRREVRDAILDTTARLAEQHGLLSVTMSQIAEETGIGRATLYKYFPDVGSILHAWHERQIDAHLGRLAEVRDRAGGPWERLEAVLQTYAELAQGSHGHADPDLAAFLHGDGQVVHAEDHLRRMLIDLLKDGVSSGDLRGDIPPSELATFCLHALVAARILKSKSAIRRLVAVTLDGLRPPE
ncbi:MAG: TetR/AcrR family transcriptional regulator [Actinomycetota bacterium]